MTVPGGLNHSWPALYWRSGLPNGRGSDSPGCYTDVVAWAAAYPILDGARELRAVLVRGPPSSAAVPASVVLPSAPPPRWRSPCVTRYTRSMPDDAFAQTLPRVAAGRAAVVARLHALATRLDQLPLDAAAEVLVLVEPALQAFEQQAALALERTAGGQSTPEAVAAIP
jgi:hypothetical protein